MKTGVLVHGCNLHIENWRYVAWGDPPFDLGRIPQGVLTALESQSESIVFGTGASKKIFTLGQTEKTGQVLAEAEYSMEYLKSHFSDLEKFEPLKKHFAESGAEKLRNQIFDSLVLDLDSHNTVDEITNAGLIFSQHDIEKVVLVSSPSHIVRCLRDAVTVFQHDKRFESFRNRIFANPSVTCYEGTSASDVVVVEPPHRPDRHVVPTHRRIHRMMMLQKLDHETLLQLIEEFDDLLQKFENKYHSN